MLKPIVLKNGLTILRFPRSGFQSFVAGFVTKTGSSIELSTGYPQGISYLIERLFWAGTDKHPNTRNLNSTLEGMGGSFYSSTTHELMELFLTVPTHQQFRAISFLAEIVQRSVFDERDLQREKESVLSILRDFQPRFESEITHVTLSGLYPESSLAEGMEGTVDSIMGIKPEDVLRYLNQQFHPEKSYLVLAGNFDNRAAMELVEQEWTYWAPKGRGYVDPQQIEHQQPQELPQFLSLQRGSQETVLTLAFQLDSGLLPSVKQLDTRENIWVSTAQLLLLNTILGKGFSSRLWSKSVEEEGFFRTIRSDLIRLSSVGHIQIAGQLENTQFSFGLESIMSNLEALRKTTVSINELAKAKELLKGTLLLEHEDILTAALWQVENLIGSGQPIDLEDLLSLIDEVSAPQIRSLAHSLFTPQRLSIVTLGTAKETRLVEKLIEKYLLS